MALSRDDEFPVSKPTPIRVDGVEFDRAADSPARNEGYSASALGSGRIGMVGGQIVEFCSAPSAQSPASRGRGLGKSESQRAKDSLRDFRGLPPSTQLADTPSIDEGVESGGFLKSDGDSDADSDADVRRFAALPPKMRRALLQYPSIIASAFHCYAVTGSGETALRQLMDKTPEMLGSVDSAEYGESPLGQALLKRHAAVSEYYIGLAGKAAGLRGRVLGHRNSSGHTLPMLAAELGAQRPELLRQLLSERPSQVHECYDCDGRNLLHHCAEDGGPPALAVILEAVGHNEAALLAALLMPDNECLTPMHRMAEAGSAAMLQQLRDWAQRRQVQLDFGQRCRHACGRSLLQVAGNEEVRRWLIDVAGVADDSREELAGSDHKEVVSYDAGFCEEEEPDESDEFQEADDAEMAEELQSLKVKPEPSPEMRTQLSQELAARGQSDAFVQRLLRLAPRLRPNEDFLKLTQDPVYVGITLLSDDKEDICQLVARALADIGQHDLCGLLKS